jgi:ABC-type lipoprotein release transport system permease subunit
MACTAGRTLAVGRLLEETLPAALLLAVALAACYVPARQAMKADVVGLLR